VKTTRSKRLGCAAIQSATVSNATGVFGFLLRVAEDPGADGAEGERADGLHLGGEAQARPVGGGEHLCVMRLRTALEDGADGVQDVPGRQAVVPGDLGRTGGFRGSLCRDDRVAVVAQARSGCIVQGVVDIGVLRAEAVEQLAVGGVDDGVGGKGRDVSPPQHGPSRGPEGRAVEHLIDRGQFE
jgi:hypothetical protein